MVNDDIGSALSDGAKALTLLLDQRAWTHRRVEALSFLPNGETRRAISWDFTLPAHLAIRVPGDRVAVPIATVRKGPLKRFDMRDAGGRALPVWGARDNGALAVDLLLSGLEGVRGEVADAVARSAVERIVYADPEADLDDELRALRRAARGGPNPADPDVLVALDSLVLTFAHSFVLVVEMPVDTVAGRTIVKASYEDDRAAKTDRVKVFGFVDIDIDAAGWGNARSWHLEVNAPEGLRVARLRHETWDPDTLDLTSASLDTSRAGTSHVNGSDLPAYDGFLADVRLVPDRSALLNPLTLGALLGSLLLWLSFVAHEAISAKLDEFGSSGAPLGAVVFGLPALFFALLTRTGEHELVSKVLLGARLASLVCAVSLWASGVVIVWSPSPDDLRRGLGLAAAVHTGALAWLLRIRSVGAGL